MSRLTVMSKVIRGVIVGNPKGKTLWEKWTEEEKIRIDADFPLGLRIGALIKDLDIADYLTALGKLIVEKPITEGRIVAIGVTDHHKGGLVDYMVRVAPPTVDDEDAEVLGTLLYVETQNGKLLSAKLFRQDGEELPQTPQEWATWIDSEEGALYRPIFWVDDKSLGRVIYQRLWREGEGAQPPLRSTEIVYHDPYGEERERNDLVQMMFGREVEGITEYVLVSMVNEGSVEILIGINTILTADNIVG